MCQELKKRNIFYSGLLDLDMTMIRAFLEYYDDNSNDRKRENLLKAILGEKGDYSKYTTLGLDDNYLSDDCLKKYRNLFCSKSKVASHYIAMDKIMKLPVADIEKNCPKGLKSLIWNAKKLVNQEGNNVN